MMFDFIWNLLSFIVALGILVTIHEFGHFWVARKNGVKVERFSIGFGKVLWRRYDNQGTEFVIALIPLGGYVKMLDERVDTVPVQDKPYAFNNKTVLQRIAIVAAGPIANFLLAIVALYFMYLIGVPSVKPIIAEIKANSLAEQASIPVPSEITQINQQSVRTWQEVNMALATAIGHETLTLSAKKVGTDYSKKYVINITDWTFSPDKQSPVESLGLIPYQPTIYTEIAQVQPESPAERAGLAVGDRILIWDGEPVENDWQTLSNLIKQYADQRVSVTIGRENRKETIEIQVGKKNNNGKTIGYLGITPKVEAYPKAYQQQIQYDVIDAVAVSVTKTWQLISMSIEMLKKLVLGQISLDNLSGPIAIAQGAGASASYGFVYFLSFLALISVNLGIINLLPLPVLDGGHLVYYFIELLTGKPVPEKVQEIGFKIGALVLLSIMSIAIFNDLSRL
jgi:regulator of sigma E protease